MARDIGTGVSWLIGTVSDSVLLPVQLIKVDWILLTYGVLMSKAATVRESFSRVFLSHVAVTAVLLSMLAGPFAAAPSIRSPRFEPRAEPTAAVPVQDDGEGWKTLDPPATDLYVCPTSITMYIGETKGVTPIATDSNGDVLHSAPMAWSTSNAAAAEPYGNAGIVANGVGTATITVTSGSAAAVLGVTVLAGERPAPGEGDYEDVDCTGAPNRQPGPQPDCPTTQGVSLGASDFPLDGGTGGDGVISLEVAAARNAVGSPYNMAQAKSPGSALPEKPKDVFGCTSYQFVASALNLGGREIAVALPLSYNSQIWSYDEPSGEMTFNVGKGWPAAGWRLGYGRIVRNFNPEVLDQHLLITGDGTRIVMVPDPAGSGGWTHKASDGSYIRL